MHGNVALAASGSVCACHRCVSDVANAQIFVRHHLLALCCRVHWQPALVLYPSWQLALYAAACVLMVSLARAALGVLCALHWASAGGTPADKSAWPSPFAESLAHVQGMQRMRARMNQWLHSGTAHGSEGRAGSSESAAWASTQAQAALQQCSGPGRLLQYNVDIRYYPGEGEGQAYGQHVAHDRLCQPLIVGAPPIGRRVDGSPWNGQAPPPAHEHALRAFTPRFSRQNDQSLAVASESASPTLVPLSHPASPPARPPALASHLQIPSPAARLPMPSSTQSLWPAMQAQVHMAALPAAQGASMLAMLAAQRYFAARCGRKLANALLALSWYALSMLCAAGVAACIGTAVFMLGK